jgi:hypothetical protein
MVVLAGRMSNMTTIRPANNRMRLRRHVDRRAFRAPLDRYCTKCYVPTHHTWTKRSVDGELTRGNRIERRQKPREVESAEPVRLATARQIRALHAIARRREIDLNLELQNRGGIARLEELSVDEASELITALGARKSHFASRDEMAQVPPENSHLK